MRGSRQRAWRGGQALGALLAALSLIHTPLPEPDFHNIRHHDSPGEVCENHDHLLRWHPGASGARDVAVLHWHWFLPTGDGSDPAPEGSGQALHAHRPDWSASPWPTTPALAADVARPDLRPEPAPHGSPLAGALLPVTSTGHGLPADLRPSQPPGATAAPVATRLARLHRWVC